VLFATTASTITATTAVSTTVLPPLLLLAPLSDADDDGLMEHFVLDLLGYCFGLGVLHWINHFGLVKMEV
jgi:hypothetical protein